MTQNDLSSRIKLVLDCVETLVKGGLRMLEWTVVSATAVAGGYLIVRAVYHFLGIALRALGV